MSVRGGAGDRLRADKRLARFFKEEQTNESSIEFHPSLAAVTFVNADDIEEDTG